MQTETMQILVTFDKNYIPPFEVMLQSLVRNNPQEKIHVWLLHSQIPQADLQALEAYCATLDAGFTPLQVDRSFFANAPISKQYPQEMYYRLLAPLLLPESIDKILYLDPDILVINPLRPLWDVDLQEKTFAAASHSDVFDLMNDVNRVRLGRTHDYFNSGVMLMDLTKARMLVKPQEIFNCVREHAAELILPDQDVFNYLYGTNTLQVEDDIWNYDARYYSSYLLRSNGAHHLSWVMEHTAILHFCGKRKPWRVSHTGRFTALYQHYMTLTKRSKSI